MATAKKLPSGKWRCLAYIGKDENGKRQYKSFTADSKKEAEFLAASYLLNKKQEESRMTIRKAIVEYIASRDGVISPSTIEGYQKIEKHRIKGIADIEISDFNTVQAQKYINALSKKYSPKTVANSWGLVSSAIAMQEPEKVFAVRLPARKKHLKELPNAAEVIAAVKGTEVELPVLLAMCCSLRMSEVRGIRYRDIKGNIMTVREVCLRLNSGDCIREQTKTYQSTRRLTLIPYVKKLIGAGEPDEHIIKLTYSQIYNRYVSAIEAAGLPHMSFHDLRHLNASVMLMLGVPEKYAMERGGWSSDATMKNVYEHTFSTEREKVDAKVNRYFEEILR